MHQWRVAMLLLHGEHNARQPTLTLTTATWTVIRKRLNWYKTVTTSCWCDHLWCNKYWHLLTGHSLDVLVLAICNTTRQCVNKLYHGNRKESPSNPTQPCLWCILRTEKAAALPALHVLSGSDNTIVGKEKHGFWKSLQSANGSTVTALNSFGATCIKLREWQHFCSNWRVRLQGLWPTNAYNRDW